MIETLQKEEIELDKWKKKFLLTSSVKSTIISKKPNPFALELAPPTKLLHQPRDLSSDKIDPFPSCPTRCET